MCVIVLCVVCARAQSVADDSSVQQRREVAVVEVAAVVVRAGKVVASDFTCVRGMMRYYYSCV